MWPQAIIDAFFLIPLFPVHSFLLIVPKISNKIRGKICVCECTSPYNVLVIKIVNLKSPHGFNQCLDSCDDILTHQTGKMFSFWFTVSSPMYDPHLFDKGTLAAFTGPWKNVQSTKDRKMSMAKWVTAIYSNWTWLVNSSKYVSLDGIYLKISVFNLAKIPKCI